MESLPTSDIVLVHGNSHPDLANSIARFVIFHLSKIKKKKTHKLKSIFFTDVWVSKVAEHLFIIKQIVKRWSKLVIQFVAKIFTLFKRALSELIKLIGFHVFFYCQRFAFVSERKLFIHFFLVSFLSAQRC